MSDTVTDLSTSQASAVAPHDGLMPTALAHAADRFQRPESYTSALQRQNVALQDQVAELHQQVRNLQLALVVEKALGVMNMRTRFLPGPGLGAAVALTRKQG